mmetsp:Transcript_6453/g.8162  ORF Transcript_6453/g.8162 Transcript_6453/m.8162 type:complete len:125 (+) Transcript_6453:978-1352(+)
MPMAMPKKKVLIEFTKGYRKATETAPRLLPIIPKKIPNRKVNLRPFIENIHGVTTRLTMDAPRKKAPSGIESNLSLDPIDFATKALDPITSVTLHMVQAHAKKQKVKSNICLVVILSSSRVTSV